MFYRDENIPACQTFYNRVKHEVYLFDMILKISSIGVGECGRLSKFFRHSFPFQRRYTCNNLKLVRIEGSRDFAKLFRSSISKELE